MYQDTDSDKTIPTTAKKSMMIITGFKDGGNNFSRKNITAMRSKAKT